MSLEAANDQDGGHSSTMDDHGVSNPPSMQVSDMVTARTLLPGTNLELSSKTLNRC